MTFWADQNGNEAAHSLCYSMEVKDVAGFRGMEKRRDWIVIEGDNIERGVIVISPGKGAQELQPTSSGGEAV